MLVFLAEKDGCGLSEKGCKMIGKLTGYVDGVYENFIYLNVSGVGYRVFCSTKTMSVLPKEEPVSLFIETQVREDHIHLFGFSSRAEQEVFNTLTEVQGVGAKVGMAILSSLGLNEISMAVATGDNKAFTRVSGIGPKLATRIVTELKGKSGLLQADMMVLNNSASVVQEAGQSRILQDAVSALVNLGYSRTEAGIKATETLKNNEGATLSDVIRLTLKEMGKANG